jgi:hypothetical protein
MIAQFGMHRNCFSQSLNFQSKGGVVSNENSSKLLKLVFIQNYPVASKGVEKDPMEHAAREYGSKGKVVNNTFEMVGQSISTCIHYRQLIGELTLVGHGASFSFRIGADVVTAERLIPGHEYYKPHIHQPLKSLTPYFHPSAKIMIQQCHCGSSDSGKDLLIKLSQLWHRPVIGFSGEITFGRGVEYQEGGQFNVCVNGLCFSPPH